MIYERFGLITNTSPRTIYEFLSPFLFESCHAERFSLFNITYVNELMDLSARFFIFILQTKQMELDKNL